jgi:mannan endo-1,4-beta-mannosidase
MRRREMVVWLLAAVCGTGISFGSEGAAKPVTPNAAPEAVELLKLIYSISGKHTLTGQHNYPNTKDKYTRLAIRNWGKIPAIYGQDMGFAKAGDQDSYLARPDIVAECKRQYALGSIVTICWHAVPPTADEPVTFRPRRLVAQRPSGPGPAPEKLASVQGKLTDEQFKDVLTPGTELYQHWCVQVDAVAGFLRQLQEARVPVLWRPYHEMNGDWFWWGGRRGEYSTARLYRQIFDRYVNYHKLTGLVWIWSVDRPEREDRKFADYYPGAEYFDVASLDVYGEFKQSYYEDLLKVAAGKPLTLAEVGQAPTIEVLAKQPGWIWWMVWAGMGGGRRGGEGPNPIQALVNDPRSWSLSDPGYLQAITPLREVSGLPSVSPAPSTPRVPAEPTP